MICKSCREAGSIASGSINIFPVFGPPPEDQAIKLHYQCPEFSRQMNPSLKPVDLIGGQWCDCHHQVIVDGEAKF